MRIALISLLFLAPPLARAVGPETRWFVPSETDCLPPDDQPPPARPVERAGADDPSARYATLPITDTFGSSIVWDEAVKSPENGTVRPTHSAACGGRRTEAPIAGPFDLRAAERTPSAP